MRTKTEIDKMYPVMATPKSIKQIDFTNTNTHTKNKETKTKLMNDTYKRNPIEILSNQQTKNFNSMEKEKSNARFNRVSNYLSSSQFKDSVMYHQTDNTVPDKITNVNITKIKTAHSMEEPKKYVNSFKHVNNNGEKRVYYA